MLEKVKGRADLLALNYDHKLVMKLNTIRAREQRPIVVADSLRKKYGMESLEAKSYDSIAHVNHAINLREITDWIEKNDWPGPNRIGQRGCTTIYLVLQHSDLETQLQYLPKMRGAARMGKVLPRHLASFEDRIATKKNRLQISGNQVKYYPRTKILDVWPIKDPEHVDRRRQSIGLRPIAFHLKRRFDLDWDIEKQKVRTAAFLKGASDQ